MAIEEYPTEVEGIPDIPRSAWRSPRVRVTCAESITCTSTEIPVCSRVNSAAKAGTRYSEGVELPAILITPGSADGSGPNLDTRASKSEIVLIANCMDSRPTSVRIAPVPCRSNKRVPNSRSEMLDLTTKPRLAHTQCVYSPRKTASFNNRFLRFQFFDIHE